MTKSRASIFTEDDEMDLSGFEPKQGPDPDALPAEEVRLVSEASKFVSREAKHNHPEGQPSQSVTKHKREARRFRTGRTAQLNTRATQQTVNEFYAIADRQGWKAAETLERAIAALKRELDT